MPPEDLRIDPEDIDAYGNVTNALSGYYADQMERLSSGNRALERLIRQWVGDRLITPSGIRGQVLRGPDTSEGLPNQMIARLIDTHLVRAEQRGGAVWYELAHDRLIEPVRSDNAQWQEAHLNPIQKMAALWEAQGRPAGLLLPRERLAEAQEWVATGATETERRYTEESAKALAVAERERRQARRLRWLAITSAIVSVVAIVAAIAAYRATRAAVTARNEAEKASQEADDARKRTVKELIEATWRSATLLGDQRNASSASSYIFGTRTLYDKLQVVMSLDKLQSLSPVPIFRSGPHKTEFELNSCEFAYYNPEFLNWGLRELIPAANVRGLRGATQRAYDVHLRELARSYYLGYKYLVGNPKLRDSTLSRYKQELEQFKGQTCGGFRTGPGVNLQEAFRPFADQMQRRRFSWDTDSVWYFANSAGGFWIRRMIDGTFLECLALLEKLLRTYDRAWLGGPESSL
jgi:hypothetical protein